MTNNVHKFNEARLVLAEQKVATVLLRVKPPEIQDDNLEEVAKASAVEAATKWNLPIIVEDAGLFVKALNGFPGPYSSYVYRTVGTKGMLQLMKGVDQRNAYFHSVVAFCDPEAPLKCFHGRVDGMLSKEERGNFGFGFDPVFEPSKGKGKTFGEMRMREKNKHSHRTEAFRKFAGWYVSAFQRRF